MPAKIGLLIDGRSKGVEVEGEEKGSGGQGQGRTRAGEDKSGGGQGMGGCSPLY